MSISELAQLEYSYARGVDTRDIDGIVGCFTPDAHVEFNGGEVRLDGADALRAFFEKAFQGPLLGARGVSTHLLANVLVQHIDGDTAHVETQGVAYLASDERDHLIVRGLNYSDDCVRWEGQWRISHRVHTALWEGQMPARALSPALEEKR